MFKELKAKYTLITLLFYGRPTVSPYAAPYVTDRVAARGLIAYNCGARESKKARAAKFG